MLTHIHISNFKAYGEPGVDLEVRPFTVLVGRNSSGQSTVLHALLAFLQTVRSRDIDNPFVADGAYVNLGAFRDFVSRHDVRTEVRLRFGFALRRPLALRTTSDIRAPSPLRRIGGTLHVDTSLSHNQQTGPLYADCTSLILVPSGPAVVKSRLGRVWSEFESMETLEENLSPSVSLPQIASEWKFVDTTSRRVNQRTRRPTLPTLEALQNTQRMVAAVEVEASHIHYVGPLRQEPGRFFLATGETPADVGVHGENTAGILAVFSSTVARRRELIQPLEQWLGRFDMTRNIDVDRVFWSVIRLSFTDNPTGTSVNVSDVGFGVSQVLPVLLQGLYADPGSTILLAQPEIHLHPAAQGTLADFLIAASTRGSTIIVETHSEHLVQRLQRRIAEGTLSPQSVAVYYFERASNGSEAREVVFDEFGAATKESLPESFFDERYEDAVAMSLAQAGRLKE